MAFAEKCTHVEYRRKSECLLDRRIKLLCFVDTKIEIHMQAMFKICYKGCVYNFRRIAMFHHL